MGDLNSVPPVKYRRCHFRNFYSNYWQEELISALLISYGVEKENLFYNQELPTLAIIFFYSRDLDVCFGLAVILQGEVRSWLHLVVWRIIGPA